MDLSRLALELAKRQHEHGNGDQTEDPNMKMPDNSGGGHENHSPDSSNNGTSGGNTMAHGDMHMMSPFLFTRTTGFFVLFHEAFIESGGAYAAAFILSLLFALLSTVLNETCKVYEKKTAENNPARFSPYAIIPALSYALRLFLHYIAMLIVMTMNVGLIIAVVAGHAFGYLIYGMLPISKSQQVKDSACH